MTEVKVSVMINRDPEEVFAYISNFENNPEWQSGMQKAMITSEGPLDVGTTYDQVAKFLGRRIVSSFEVIAYEPGRMIKATSTSGSFPITFMRRVDPLEGGAQVTAVIEGDAGGFFKLAEPLLNRMTRRSIEKDYAHLKELLESRG